MVVLPFGARVYGDKDYIDLKEAASILRDTEFRLIAIRRKNMRPLDWVDKYNLRQYRMSIETINSQLESMGLERLHARTKPLVERELKSHVKLKA